MADKLHTIISYFRHALTASHGGHGIHSPFAYALCENVFYSSEKFYEFERLAELRSQLRNDHQLINAENFGAGSRAFPSAIRRISDIALHGVTEQRQSEMLYRLSNFLGIRATIELGTSLGINTLYLAQQNPRGKVFTIEGSMGLSAYAKELAVKAGTGNIEFICGRFIDELPQVMARVQEPVLVYVDGDHSYDATVRLFRSLVPLATENNVFVFDDIYWSRGMTKAWREIIADPRVRLSIDCFKMGLIFFRPEIREKIALKLRL